MAMVFAPAVVLFTARTGVDDDDSYLKMLQRITMNMYQPYSPFDAMRFITEPSIPFKVLAKRLGAYAELSKSLFLWSIGNDQDALTQKGYLKGLKETARYSGLGPIAAGYKM
jgi:hypothetical protein